jgi:uncharacterized phiE125 gp8 family phage protein
MYTDPYLMRDPLRVARDHLLERATAPASEPLTLDEVKLYVRVDTTDDDALLADLIVAARMMAESWLRKSLLPQAWKLAYDYGIPESVWLPMGPVTSIASVTVVNDDASTQVLVSTGYWLNAAKNMLIVGGVLTGRRIEIVYNTGYADAASVPAQIKQGMLAHIASMYDSRGDVGAMMLPEQSVGLYTPLREIRL